jgi:hypothetical protein
MSDMLAGNPFQDGLGDVVEETQDAKIVKVKKSTLYQVIVATAMCMIKSEKEKRHTLLDLITSAGEGGAGG